MRVRIRRIAVLSLFFLAAAGVIFASDTAMRVRIEEEAPEFRLPGNFRA
jgi:hypothetical protein